MEKIHFACLQKNEQAERGQKGLGIFLLTKFYDSLAETAAGNSKNVS